MIRCREGTRWYTPLFLMLSFKQGINCHSEAKLVGKACE